MKGIYLIVLLVLSSCVVISQTDSITLLNGKVISGIKITEGENIREVNFLKNDRLRILEKMDVFSVNMNNTEIVFYQPDSLRGYDFTIPQMRSFILGEQIARKKYHAPGAILGGIIVGAYCGSGENFSPFIGTLGPLVYSAIVGIKNAKIKGKKKIDESLLNNPEFVMGYQKYARNKKVRNAAISSVASFIVSLIFVKSTL